MAGRGCAAEAATTFYPRGLGARRLMLHALLRFGDPYASSPIYMARFVTEPRVRTGCLTISLSCCSGCSVVLSGGLEPCSGGHHAVVQVPPQSYQQLARQGHDADALAALGARVAEAAHIPLGQIAGGLQSQPGPGNLHHGCSHAAVAVLAETLFSSTVAAVI